MQWTVTQTSAAGQWTGTVVGDKPAFIAGGGQSAAMAMDQNPVALLNIKHIQTDIYIIDVSEPWVFQSAIFTGEMI